MGGLSVKLPLLIKKDTLSRIQKGEVQKGRHDPGAEVFSPAGAEVLPGSPLHGPESGPELLLQVQAEAQLRRDFLEAAGHRGEGLRHVPTLPGLLVAAVQLVCDFDILREPLARGGDHHKPALLLQSENVSDHLKVCGVTQRGAAEFCCYHIYLSSCLARWGRQCQIKKSQSVGKSRRRSGFAEALGITAYPAAGASGRPHPAAPPTACPAYALLPASGCLKAILPDPPWCTAPGPYPEGRRRRPVHPGPGGHGRGPRASG